MLLAAEMFGSKHLMGLAIGLVFVGLLFFISERYLKKNRRTMLIVVTILFYVLEAAKIGYIMSGNGWSYPMNHLPFHLCSLPLYLMPLLLFVKNETLLQYVKPALVAGLLFGGIIAMLYPTNIIGNGESFFPIGENVLEWISFLYHPLMIFTAVYVIYTGIYRIKFENFYKAFPIIIIYMLMAMVVNSLLDKDFMLLNRGSGSPFQFMIDSFGQFPYVLTMIALGLFGMFLFHSFAFVLVKEENVTERILRYQE